MKLENWIDKQDGIDDVLAKDINDIAHAVQDNSNDIDELSKNKANTEDVPQNVSELENDSGYVTNEDIKDKVDKNNILNYITYKIYIDEYVEFAGGACNNEVGIIGCDTNISGAQIIPDTIEGYPVTVIDSYAFENCTALESVIIPASVTSIGWDAFKGCTALTSVVIPNGIVRLESNVFKNCTALESVILPNSLTYISTAVFAGCPKLKNIEIPNGVTTIDDNAFKNCTALTSVIIPASVTYIAWSFGGCTSLKDIYYGGTKEDWDNADMYLWWIVGEEDYNYDAFKDDVTIHYKYGDVPTPTENTDAANKEYVDEVLKSKADKPSVAFADGDTITLADNTTYYAEGEISNLTVVYPEGDFISSLEFTLATEGDVTITLPQSRYIGGAPTFANGETWELNIKNGVVVGGLVE